MKIILLSQFVPTHSDCDLTIEEKTILNNYIKPIYEVLINLGHYVKVETDPQNLLKYSTEFDLVFSLYTRIGFKNYEVFVSNICNYLDIACNGATYNIKALAEDKVFAKIYAKHLGIATPTWFELSCREKMPPLSQLPFPSPYFIKPRTSGASIGINEKSLCYDYECLEKQFQYISSFRMNSIVESYINGPLITVPIIRTSNKLYYTAYQLTTNEPNGIISHEIKKGLHNDYFCIRSKPHKNIELEAVEKTILMFNSLKDCRYARFDFILDNSSHKLLFLEFNTCPNIQEQSGFFISLKDKYSISYPTFISLILQSCI